MTVLLNVNFLIYVKANSLHEFTSKLEEEKLNLVNIKKVSLYTPKNYAKNIDENLTFKKQSPAVMNRERCYSETDNFELNQKDNEVGRTENINTVEISIHNETDNILGLNADNDENLPNLVNPQIFYAKSSALNKKENEKNQNVQIESGKKSPNLLKLNDTNKHHRKKSSFFNSEDLRVSKQETFKILDKSQLYTNLFNKFSVISNNKSSKQIDLDIDKQFNQNNDNSLVKIEDSKSEISQNNIKSEILSQNFSSIIINNNNTHNNIKNNINNNGNIINEIIVDNMNAFDFDLKDSPVKVNSIHQNFMSYDNKSSKYQPILATNATRNDYHTSSNHESVLSKKTKSFDLFSISNQINIDLMYSNKKLAEDKSKVKKKFNI